MKKVVKKRNVAPSTRGIYQAYMFKDKDPAIDELRTMVEDNFGGRVNYKMLSNMHNDGGPSTSCMANWFFGKTRRPTNPALEAAGRALGFRRQWVKLKKGD